MDEDFKILLIWMVENKPLEMQNADGRWHKASYPAILQRLADEYPVSTFRIAPEMVKLNGIMVPAPITEAPEPDEVLYLACVMPTCGYVRIYWYGLASQTYWLENKLLHTTKEGAIAHTQEMLKILKP